MSKPNFTNTVRKLRIPMTLIATLTVIAMPLSRMSYAATSQGSAPYTNATFSPLADGTGYVCLTANEATGCVDKPANGDQLQIDVGAQYVRHNVGHVQGGNPGSPFYGTGTNLNGLYAGSQIIWLEDPSNTSRCVRIDTATPSRATIGGCGTNADLVEAQTNNGIELIGVGASSSNDDNGAEEYLSPGGSDSKGTDLVFLSGTNGVYTNWILP